MSMKSFKYRMYPNKEATAKLEWILERCRELYNAALTERKEAYRMAGKSINFFDQDKQMPEIKDKIRPEYKEIGSHVLRNVLMRVDRAYQAFFRRVKNGEKPGFPRFKGKNWYDSFTYPDISGWKFAPGEKKHAKLHLSKLGSINVKMHRPIEGKIKTCTIKREGDHWYVTFVCEIEADKLPVSYEDVGIDLGITHFAACSDGTFIDSPRHYRKAEKKLKKLQEALSRKKRGSHRRRRAVKALARAHRKIRNQRRDFAHKASRKLVNRYQVLVLEDLKTANLVRRPKPKQDEQTGQYFPNGVSAKTGLNKSISDAGWSTFTEMLSVKAAWAGRLVLLVNPSKTSQICPNCGVTREKDLSERWHSCACGCELDRDTASAKVILDRGRNQLG